MNNIMRVKFWFINITFWFMNIIFWFIKIISLFMNIIFWFMNIIICITFKNGSLACRFTKQYIFGGIILNSNHTIIIKSILLINFMNLRA